MSNSSPSVAALSTDRPVAHHRRQLGEEQPRVAPRAAQGAIVLRLGERQRLVPEEGLGLRARRLPER